MEEQDSLERKALRNTRALIDKLEATEAIQATSQRRALIFLGVAVTLVLGVVTAVTFGRPDASTKGKRQQDCEVNARAARASELEAKYRREYPDETFKEIARKVKSDQPAIDSWVKARCNATEEQK